MEIFIKRKERRMTQKEVADKLGISPDGYRKKENGHYDFTLREAQALAKMYNCTLDDLFGVDKNESA